MKKSLFVLSFALLPSLVFAQDAVVPKFETGVYAVRLSPNGKWLGSRAGDASIYNMETGENIYYSPCFLGIGNCVADNGMAVGEAQDVGALLYNGSVTYPPSLTKYNFCDINAITPDGTRITGIVGNPKRDGVAYVPFIADLDANGNVGEPVILPYPKLDFFRAAPQYATGVWISDDGKTVAGMVQDWRGMYAYPIYYKEGANGEWSYTTPSESLFNPTGIDIPDNPWLNEPPFPEPENFMTGTAKEAYLEAFEKYSTGGGVFPYPYPQDYMTEAQYEEYVQAVEKYNEWYYGQEGLIKEYIKIYAEVLQTTPSFSNNDMALHPSGDYFMIHGGKENSEYEMMGTIYSFSTISDEWSTIDPPQSSYYPHQILPDGTLVVTKPITAVPNAYLLLPGSEKFITLQEYFEPTHPEISEWLDKKVPGGTGLVSISNDMTVFTGGLVPDQLSDFDWDNSPFYYSTYFIDLGTAGIESVVDTPKEGVFSVYNLQGVKVMETRDASMLKTLDKGVYIVNGKKIII